jgi:acetamidase/formamidase
LDKPNIGCVQDHKAHLANAPFMRIEKPDALIAIHANKPLETAVETATFHLMDWLITEYGFTPTDAYCLVSTCPDFRINVYQMCKIGKLSYVAGARFRSATWGAEVAVICVVSR